MSIADPGALFPTAYIKNGSAFDWVSSYISQDPDVQRQLRDRIIPAEDEGGSQSRDPRMLSTVKKRKDQSWTKDGVIAIIDSVLSGF
jgi:hypothetical protein